MAAKSFGTVFLYGVTGALTNGAVQSFKLKSEQKNTATTDDENGNEIERRRDDQHDEATISFKYRSGYAIPSPSDVINYEGQNWEVVSVDRNEGGKTHRMLELSVKKSQYISSASSTTIATTTSGS